MTVAHTNSNFYLAPLLPHSMADTRQLRPQGIARDFPQHGWSEHVGRRGEQHANVPHGGCTLFVLYDASQKT